MTYIENIFVCMAAPLAVTLLFLPRRSRPALLFCLAGMLSCLLSAYLNTFFARYYGADAVNAATQVAPVVEEIMKLLPLLFFYLIFEPEPKEMPAAAIAIAVGFATFENVCYLTENGAANFNFLLIRGISAGALHLLCGVLSGFGISYVFRRRWLAATGAVGILGACIGFHAIYNLLITAEGAWKTAGYLFPSFLIVCLYLVKQLLPRQRGFL